MIMEKISSAIVTGATSMLGAALIKRLVQENIHVYAVCRASSARWGSIGKHPLVHIVKCDLQNMEALPEKIGASCDAFFHFAWLGTEEPKNRLNVHLQADNIRFSATAVDAAHALGCKVFVGAGSQAEYGHVEGVIRPDSPVNPVSAYGMAKLCTGQMTRLQCSQYGIRHIWPRIISTYGPNSRVVTLLDVVVQKLLAGERPALTAGEQIWDYLYVSDAVDAFYRMACAGRDGAVYVLGSGKTKRLREFMEIIRDAIDPELPLGIGEIPYYPDQAMHLEADITTLTQDTGWQPQVEFRDGIAEILKNYRMPH